MKTIASTSRTETFVGTLSAGLLVAYLATVHMVVLDGATGSAFLLLLLPLLLPFVPGTAGRVLLVLGGVLAAALGGAAALEHGPPLFYLPPILINLAMALLFGRTLRAGSRPLITRYAMLLHPQLDRDVVGYTRSVTRVWTGFFLFLAAESLLLALYAPLEVWSLFCNVLNYVFTALLFVGEYRYRLRRLPGLDHPGFLQFLSVVMRHHVSKTHRLH